MMSRAARKYGSIIVAVAIAFIAGTMALGRCSSVRQRDPANGGSDAGSTPGKSDFSGNHDSHRSDPPGSLVGIVVDQCGAPVAGAEIEVTPLVKPEQGEAGVVTSSKGDGKFAVQLAVGTYQVMAGISVGKVQPLHYRTEPVRVDVPRPSTGEFRIVMTLPPLVRLTGTVRVSGVDTVRDVTIGIIDEFARSPEELLALLPYLPCDLSQEEFKSRPRQASRLFREFISAAAAEVDTEGNYALTARLPPWRYSVEAASRRFSGTDPDDPRYKFTVPATGFEGRFDFELKRLPLYKISGRIVDDGGKPVANARVMLRWYQRPNKSGTLNQFVETGPEGTFSGELHYDSTLVRVMHPQWKTALIEREDLIADADSSPLEIRMSRKDYEIKGRIVFQNQAVPSEYVLQCSESGKETLATGGLNAYFTVPLGSDGAFSFRADADKEYSFQLFHSGSPTTLSLSPRGGVRFTRDESQFEIRARN